MMRLILVLLPADEDEDDDKDDGVSYCQLMVPAALVTNE